MLEFVGLFTGLAFFWISLRRVTGPLTLVRGNPWAPFFLLTVVLTVPGLAAVSLFEPDIDYLGLVSPVARNQAVWAVVYSLLTLPLGVLVADFAWRKMAPERPTTELRVYATGLSAPQRKYLVVTSILFVAVALFTVGYVYSNLAAIPAFTLIRSMGSPVELAQARIMAARGFMGNTYIRNIIGLTFVPLTSCMVYATYLVTRERVMKWAFALSCAATTAMLTYDLSKAPIVFYALALFVTRVCVEGYSPRIGRRSLIVGLWGVGFMGSLYVVLMGVTVRDVFDIWNVQSLAYRTVFGQVQPLLLHFQIFPQSVPFQYGASIAGFLRPESVAIPARLVMEWVNPWGVAQGTAGVMNTHYIGEAWADFGYFGVLFLPGLVGFAWHWIFRYVKSKQTPMWTGLLAFLAVHVASISQASATRLFYNPELIASITLVVGCMFLSRLVTRIAMNRRGETETDANSLRNR